MKKITFKKWISLSTAIIFMFQQISPAFAMEEGEPLSPSPKSGRRKTQAASAVQTQLTDNERKQIATKVAENKSLSPEEENKFKLISEEVVNDLLHIKDTFSVKAEGDLVIVIGQTGSGKTALTEWLGGEKTLKTEEGTYGNFFFTSESGHIRKGAISGTTSPILYQIDDNIYCADTPGFDDTRGVLQTTKNAVYMRELLRNNPSAKFIVAELVSNLAPNSGRGVEFKKTLCFLKNMFTDTFFTKNLPLQDSLNLVVTHYDNTCRLTKLPNLQKWITTDLVEGAEGVIKNILTSFSQENKIAFFSEPLEATNPFQNDEEKRALLNNINATKSLTFSFDEDIQSSFSLQSQLLLKKIQEGLKIDFILLLKAMVQKELLPCVYNKIIAFKDEVDVAVSEAMKTYTFFSPIDKQVSDQLRNRRSTWFIECYRLMFNPLQRWGIDFDNFGYHNCSPVYVISGSLAAAFAPQYFLPIGAANMAHLARAFYAHLGNKAHEYITYEDYQWEINKNQKAVTLCHQFNDLSKGLESFQDLSKGLESFQVDLCSNLFLGENGVLKQFKPGIKLSEIQKTATSLDYLSYLLMDKSTVSKDIWTSVFENFQKMILQYAGQSGEELYQTAKDLLKKKREKALILLIEQVQKKLPHLSQAFIKTVVHNLEEADPYEDVNVTGSPLSPKKVDQFISHMNLCSHVYTDESTRSIIIKAAPSITEKWNELISHKKEIKELCEGLLQISKKERDLQTQPTLYEQAPTKTTPSTQVPALPTETQMPELETRYTHCIKKINGFFQRIGRDPIVSTQLSELSSSLRLLEKVYADINRNCSLYFTKNSAKACYEYRDLYENSHYLTNEGIVASSFLNKSYLLGNTNVTILKVGFRNLQDLSGICENVIAKGVTFKDNPTSWFEDWGEVDYIAYLENDSTPLRKDKFVIVYSGSNSQKDWVKNFTLGNQQCVNLSAHEGITNLFNDSAEGHNVLVDCIDHYYKAHRKPKKFKVITTGHSLGGALASLGLYYHKSNSENRLKTSTGLEKISFKTFLFGSPAIFDQPSKILYEQKIGLKNIFRIWNANDIVVTLTDKAIWQGGEHIGTSYPLYNMNDLRTNISDIIWGPHGIDSYRCHLRDLQQNNPNHQLFTAMLKDYMKDPYTYEERQNQKDKK